MYVASSHCVLYQLYMLEITVKPLDSLFLEKAPKCRLSSMRGEMGVGTAGGVNGCVEREVWAV